MAKIQVLDAHVAELIAAGEVVERPSSVIKELVENAVDAGATVITVEIRNGGITFMRVSDNGCGIPAQEVPTAFLRHATSKVLCQNDLESIATLGFRGEALASISAVARVELLTKTKEAPLGARYLAGGSEAGVLEEAGCPNGTTILIRDLFFNVPARMKFLKKDSTEGNAVAGMMDKLALSHPEISFRFIREGKEVLHTPGDNQLSSAIYGVFGKEFHSGLIPVSYELNHVKVSGFISTPASSRPNRTMQNFFINGRFIRSRTASAALEEAFKGSIMVGKFPACVLGLSLSFEAVDVNVHPAKLEVRFVNEKPIFEAVYHGVKSALHAGDKAKVMALKKPTLPLYTPESGDQMVLSPSPKEGAPSMTLPRASAPPVSVPSSAPNNLSIPLFSDSAASSSRWDAKGRIEAVLDHMPVPEVPPQEMPAPKPPLEQIYSPVEEEAPVETERENSFLQEALLEAESKETVPEEMHLASSPDASKLPLADALSVRLLGEAFGTYMVVQVDEEALMLIDKHAAHERLLYERLKVQGGGRCVQGLLQPLPVTLDKDEYTAVLDHVEALAQVGFEIEDFGGGTVLVRGVPMLMEGAEAGQAVMEIAGYLTSCRTSLTTEHMDWIYHNVACRAAVKAGDFTSREELIALARDLEQNPRVRYCPHGRPVSILIPKKDIERQFGRT